MTTVFVLDDVEVSTVADVTLPSAAEVSVLSFASNPRVEETVLERFENRGINVDVTSAAGELDEVAMDVREKYSELVDEFPNEYQLDGRPLNEAHTFDGSLSLWWLNCVSAKRSDIRPTFTRLCQLEVLRGEATTLQPESLTLLTDDPDFRHVVSEFCETEDIEFTFLGITAATDPVTFRVLFGILLRTVAWMGQKTLQSVLARVLFGTTSGTRSGEGCVFHTIYPDLWQVGSDREDEKYRGVPAAVHDRYDGPVSYATTLADGYHQSPDTREFLSYCRELASLEGSADISTIDVVDAHLRWRDLLRVLAALRVVPSYYRLLKREDFREAWRYDGINIFPLIRREFRIAMLTLPRHLLHMTCVRSFVERNDPDCFVTYQFEFASGRAMVHGAKSADSDCHVVGVQHGPISKRKLMYHFHGSAVSPVDPDAPDAIAHVPTPDSLLVEGRGAKETLVEGGYPAESITVAGAPRLVDLQDVPVHARDTDGARTALVAFAHSDGVPTLLTCLHALEEMSDWKFVFKPHPRGDLPPSRLGDLLEEYGIAEDGYEISNEGFYEVLPDVDVVLTTYSSVGMEALARSYGVVCLQLPNAVNVSPLLDIETPDVALVTGTTDLSNALDAVESTGTYERTDISYFFEYLDANPEREWVTAILSEGLE